MANMSYCKFRNTVSDLRDCIETLMGGDNVISRDEAKEAENLVKMMLEFVEDVGEDMDPKEYIAERLEDNVKEEIEE